MFRPSYIHVQVKEAPKGVYQLISLRGEAFEGGIFLHRREVVFSLQWGGASALALRELTVPNFTTGTRLQMQPVWVGSSLVEADLGFPKIQGHGEILRGGEYAGIGAWKKEEVSVLPLLSTTARTPLSLVKSSSLFSTLSVRSVELRNVYMSFGREKITPLPHTSIALRACTVPRLNCTLWYHDNLAKD